MFRAPGVVWAKSGDGEVGGVEALFKIRNIQQTT